MGWVTAASGVEDHFRYESPSAATAFRGAIHAVAPDAGLRFAARRISKVSKSSQ